MATDFENRQKAASNKKLDFTDLKLISISVCHVWKGNL